VAVVVGCRGRSDVQSVVDDVGRGGESIWARVLRCSSGV
jgi:hypothetical protein